LEEGKVVGGEEREEGKKMERDEKEKIVVEKGKWQYRRLSELVLGQNGEGI
jgi:hypothetical protein